MYIQKLEKNELSQVPLIDFWVKLGPLLLLGVFIYTLNAMGAYFSGADFWLWQGYSAIIFLISIPILVSLAWKLQTPLDIRPRFVHQFTSMFHGYLFFFIGVIEIAVWRAWWIFWWAIVCILLTQLINYIIVLGLNQLYRRAAFYQTNPKK